MGGWCHVGWMDGGQVGLVGGGWKGLWVDGVMGGGVMVGGGGQGVYICG